MHEDEDEDEDGGTKTHLGLTAVEAGDVEGELLGDAAVLVLSDHGDDVGLLHQIGMGHRRSTC